MLKPLKDYLSMIKFSHSIFALPFAGIAVLEALWGSGIQNSSSSEVYSLIGAVILCMVFLRSAAMGFNRIADRDFDERNPRTSNREIASGIISVKNAWIFVILFLIAFFVTAFWINPLTGILSPAAALLVLGYSYTKRFTMFAHFFLGLAIGLAPTAAWIAVRAEITSVLPVIWSLGMIFYIAGFDILYSCQDADFDRKMGLHSMPSRLGIEKSLWIARFSHIAALVFFISAAQYSRAGFIFYSTIAVTGGLFLYEHYLVRKDRLNNIPFAFFNVNASISTVLFTGLLLDKIFLSI